MIISRSPYRLSLFGGGSDFPSFYNEHGGAVLGTTIDKFCYISLRKLGPFFEHKHRIVWSQIELPSSIEEIHHPAVRAILTEAHIREGVEIQHQGDLPARSGIGSSSAFTVGLLAATTVWHGYTPHAATLAAEAIRIEQDVLKEAVGSQDQIWAAYGGTRLIRFSAEGFEVEDASEHDAELQAHLMLFFTGLSRTAASIEKKKLANLGKKISQLGQLRESAEEGHRILCSGRVTECGKLLRETWALKKELADGVTNPMIDGVYEAALSAGALGGKLLGAGGGGFFLVFAAPEAQPKIRERLRALTEVPVRIGSPGSTIIYSS